jgi:hypothetical protein
MRLRWWEGALLVLPLLLIALFFAARQWAPAAVLCGLTLFGVASRAQLVERNVAGFYARQRGRLLLLRATALLIVYLVIVYGFWVMHRQHWTRDTHGIVAFYASGALAAFLIRDIWRLGNEGERWIIGGEAEEAVAAELDTLRDEGWVVLHNVLRETGGNVDHFLSGPKGAFVIETKSGKYRPVDRGQTINNAVWMKRRFGVRWVTPILCVGTDPPTEPMLVRHGNATMWVMGRSQLRAWLAAQPPSR